jgi:hypothetical protein
MIQQQVMGVIPALPRCAPRDVSNPYPPALSIALFGHPVSCPRVSTSTVNPKDQYKDPGTSSKVEQSLSES